MLKFNCSITSDSLWLHGLQLPGFPVLHYFLEFTQTHVCWIDDAIQPSHPLSPPSPPSLNLAQQQSLFHEFALGIRWPKDWSFSFSISPSNEYSALISFRIDWFDLFAVQGILRSILHEDDSKEEQRPGKRRPSILRSLNFGVLYLTVWT